MKAVCHVIFGRGRSMLLLVIAVALVALACAGPPEDDGPQIVQESVYGLIRGLEAKSLLALESVDVTDDGGKMWHFDAKGKTFATFTPSHLNEHMLLGLRVTVVFHREGEILVVDEITD